MSRLPSLSRSESADRHIANGTDGGIAVARGEGAVTLAEIDLNVTSGTENEVEFAVFVEIAAGQIWPLRR